MGLLFASSVRLHGEFHQNTPLEADTVMQVPEHVQLNCPLLLTRPPSLQKARNCPTCREKVEADRLFEVSYKLILEYEQQRGSSESACIPKAMQQLHPRLTWEEYKTLQHDIAFQYKMA